MVIDNCWVIIGIGEVLRGVSSMVLIFKDDVAWRMLVRTGEIGLLIKW